MSKGFGSSWRLIQASDWQEEWHGALSSVNVGSETMTIMLAIEQLQ